MTYARNTTVSPERSQEQIKATLRRYGVDSMCVYERGGMAAIGFEIGQLAIRIDVSLPVKDEPEFTLSPTGKIRSEDSAYKAWEQTIKQRWRALLLAIKAKLEAVETGISTLETEFMPFVVMPGGETLGQHLLPKLRQMATTGKMPPLLPSLPGPVRGMTNED